MLFKAKDFDPMLVLVDPNKQHIVGRSSSNKVLYNNQPLTVQLGPVVVSRGLYERQGKFCVNLLCPNDSVLANFITKLNTALHGSTPIVRTTQDNTGTYLHVRLRVTLPGLIQGTLGDFKPSVGSTVRVIAYVDSVRDTGEWELRAESIAQASAAI